MILTDSELANKPNQTKQTYQPNNKQTNKQTSNQSNQTSKQTNNPNKTYKTKHLT
jgi:hypothetical protein